MGLGGSHHDTLTGADASWRSALGALRGRIGDWIGERFEGDEARAFADENLDREIRRLRVLAPLMILLHLTHIYLHWVPALARNAAPVDATVLRWHDAVWWVHVVTFPLAVFLSAAAWGWPRSRIAPWLMAIGGAGYLAHGGMATGVDQIILVNVAAFTGFCFGIAVICNFPPRTSIWVYGIGTTVAVAAMLEFQPDPKLRLSNLTNMGTLITVSLALNWLFAAARRRDFRQRRTIARQRDELAELNESLERRVDEQVAEIVRRAEEVSQLNAQLRSQIRARSSELSAALARLARQRETDSQIRPGVVLGGRFEIGDSIGAGGMGMVFSGSDRATGQAVAIKVVRPTSHIELDAMRRFVAEASAVASVTHPAVVRMIHVDITDDGLLYQAQELVDGQTLEERMAAGIRWPDTTVARFGEVLFDALAAAHARGVIHRDVKPANVMLTRDAPGLKLLDFGLAKLYDHAAEDAEHRTGTGLVVGTPAYMAPEQVRAVDATDKTDVYAAGLLLFQLLTGRHVFEIDGASRIMMSHVAEQAPDVRTLREETSAELAALISECLSKSPGARPTAAQASSRLRDFADVRAAPALNEVQQLSPAGSILRRFR